MSRRLIKKMIPTRYCACPELDCRFKPSTIKCPFHAYTNGKWLWGTAFIDSETGEEVSPTIEDSIIEQQPFQPQQINSTNTEGLENVEQEV